MIFYNGQCNMSQRGKKKHQLPVQWWNFYTIVTLYEFFIVVHMSNNALKRSSISETRIIKK